MIMPTLLKVVERHQGRRNVSVQHPDFHDGARIGYAAVQAVGALWVIGRIWSVIRGRSNGRLIRLVVVIVKVCGEQSPSLTILD